MTRSVWHSSVSRSVTMTSSSSLSAGARSSRTLSLRTTQSFRSGVTGTMETSARSTGAKFRTLTCSHTHRRVRTSVLPELRGGGQEGSGTRSSLLWECRRAIIAKRPRFLLLENVSNLVSEKFIATFRKWEQELASYGYDNRYKVLNSKDYGVPQNRERVFLVSFLDYQIFNFPQPIPLEKRLKDVLEDKVDERYYLSDKALAGLLEHNEKCEQRGTGFLFSPKDISVNGGVCQLHRNEARLRDRNIHHLRRLSKSRN